jgi:hypothetical protein
VLGSLKLTKNLLLFSTVTIVALTVSIITHTWIPVFIAVALDIGVTGIMIELNNQEKNNVNKDS